MFWDIWRSGGLLNLAHGPHPWADYFALFNEDNDIGWALTVSDHMLLETVVACYNVALRAQDQVKSAGNTRTITTDQFLRRLFLTVSKKLGQHPNFRLTT